MNKVFFLLFLFINQLVCAETIYVTNENIDIHIPKIKENNSGLKVTYNRDESSPLAWNVNCTKDRFNNLKSCSIDKPVADIFIYYAKGQYSVKIGQNHYPRTSSAIKIDDNAPIYGYEGKSNTPLKVIEQMKTGKLAYTRYQEWPYKYNQDSEVSLEGFAEALEKMKVDYGNL